MKKFLIALTACVIFFGGQTQAAPVDDLNAKIETQETSAWPEIRDKLLGRETDKERRHRYQPPHYHDRYHGRDGRGYQPPPPPPPRHHHRW